MKKTVGKKGFSFIIILLMISLLVSCSCQKQTTFFPYHSLGIRTEQGAAIEYIVIEVEDINAVKQADLVKIVQHLIKNGNPQNLMKQNHAYYFFDESQNASVNLTEPEAAKAYYWIITKLLVFQKGQNTVEVDWEK